MSSYERDIHNRIKYKKGLPVKLDIPLLKYLWQANPLTGNRKKTIPKYLRNIEALKNFNDNELRILSKYLHSRTFGNDEVVFKQFDIGVGFYFIYSGSVDIIAEQDSSTAVQLDENDEIPPKVILTLEEFDYFGELALLRDNSTRSATVIAKNPTELLGLFKPDMEDLISDHPVVGTKLLQSISVIIANRLFSVTDEVGRLKTRLSQLEQKYEELQGNK